MSHQSATASTFYYKRNTFFTVLVYISVIGCIASIVQCIFGILAGWNFTSMVLNGTTAIFGLSWDIQILRKKDFFYSGNLTKVPKLFLFFS